MFGKLGTCVLVTLSTLKLDLAGVVCCDRMMAAIQYELVQLYDGAPQRKEQAALCGAGLVGA
jgi:hypothetical protein